MIQLSIKEIIEENGDDSVIKERKQLIENEKDASNRGLELMKKSGASKEEIKHAKKTLKLARKDYKNLGDIYVNTAKIKKINPGELLDD